MSQLKQVLDEARVKFTEAAGVLAQAVADASMRDAIAGAAQITVGAANVDGAPSEREQAKAPVARDPWFTGQWSAAPTQEQVFIGHPAGGPAPTIQKVRPKGAPPLAEPVVCGCPGSPTRAPRVYICGPMAAIKDHNFPAFDRAAAEWREAGWEVLNPADMDRADPLDTKELALQEPTPTRRRMVMRDLDALQRADAVAVLELKDYSVWGSGSFAERAVASWLRIPIWHKPYGVRWVLGKGEASW